MLKSITETSWSIRIPEDEVVNRNSLKDLARQLRYRSVGAFLHALILEQYAAELKAYHNLTPNHAPTHNQPDSNGHNPELESVS